jgi:aspartyl/asparaginyl beta-hydroxylase (cupin superfamily)
VGSDLEGEQQAYEERRRELEGLLPRARRLCLKHRLRESFSGLLRIQLGQYVPQQRMDSAIGRNERSAVAKCLVQLHDACQEWAPAEAEAPEKAEPADGSLLRRLKSYFY